MIRPSFGEGSFEVVKTDRSFHFLSSFLVFLACLVSAGRPPPADRARGPASALVVKPEDDAPGSSHTLRVYACVVGDDLPAVLIAGQLVIQLLWGVAVGEIGLPAVLERVPA